MEIVQYVKQIQDLLKLHDRAVNQITLIDSYMNAVSRQAFYCAINGSYLQVMHLMLRKSVAQGIKKMLKIYRLHKWFAVQNIVQKVARYYQWEHGMNILASMDEFYRFPDMGRLSKEDIAAKSWTVLDCEFHRKD